MMGHLKAAHEGKEDAGEEWRPCKLVKQHLGYYCPVGLGLLGINIFVQQGVPQVPYVKSIGHKLISTGMIGLVANRY